MEIRKVRTPINIKLTAAVLALTGITLSSYVWLAVDLIKDDKIAYVFESVESQNQQSAKVLEGRLKQITTFHEVFRQVSYNNAAVQQIFNKNPDLLLFVEKINGNQRKTLINRKANSQLKADQINWNQLTDKPYQIIEANKVLFLVQTLNENKKKSHLVLPLKNIKQLLPSSKLYQHDMAFGDKLIAESDISLDKKPISYGLQTKVLGKNIISFRPYLEDIVFLTQTDYAKALQAASVLTSQSIYFGILVAGFIILAILLLSHKLTNPIKRLYEASQELSKANFSYRVKIPQRDEVGVLGDSFNFMASEIQKYLAEMKEKSRMENELKTAQLVQQSFFPADILQGENFRLQAFYQPADECSGDWWGHLETDDSDVFIILDVTGHGTAAALVTAMMHNTLTNLEQLGMKDATYRLKPEVIMSLFNRSLCAVNIEFNATAFVMVLNEGNLSYCNASHNPPLLFRKKETAINKQDIIPLNENLGKRLGEDARSDYRSSQFKWSQQDQIVLYTDGIMEAQNQDDKPYGARRFMKNLLDQYNNDSIQTSNILDSFDSFRGSVSPDDDITIMTLTLEISNIYKTFDEPLNLTFEHKSVDKSEEASVIIYDNLISKTFAEINMGSRLKAIVDKKEFEKRKKPLRPRKISLEQKVELKFENESVSKVGEKIEKALSSIIKQDSFSEMKRYLKQTGIELVQNALIYQRSNGVVLPVTLELGRNNDYYSIEVVDLNGQLDPLVILNKAKRAFIERTYETKETGAGLGSSMVILGSDEVSIKVKASEYTKIRCIIGKYKRLKEFKLKNNAIYISKG